MSEDTLVITFDAHDLQIIAAALAIAATIVPSKIAAKYDDVFDRIERALERAA